MNLELIAILAQNLLSPMVLFFFLGMAMGFLKSDLEIPKSIESFLAIYLIIAIGFKGGVSFRSVSFNNAMLITILLGVVSGFLIPLAGYKILRMATTLSPINAAAVAAHYGSISIVTFLTATAFLKNLNIGYQSFIVGILAIMEVPAIIMALLFARRLSSSHQVPFSESVRELLSNGSIMLLIGSIAIGYAASSADYSKLKTFFVDPFYGVLSVFLLSVGIKASGASENLKLLSSRLVAFAVFMPACCGILGLIVSRMVGLDLGTGLLFGVLMASASYIAVPATLKISLPEANPSIYMPMSLGITFPFNIIFGIPFYYYLSLVLWA